jgi:hypothetical protein
MFPQMLIGWQTKDSFFQFFCPETYISIQDKYFLTMFNAVEAAKSSHFEVEEAWAMKGKYGANGQSSFWVRTMR